MPLLVIQLYVYRRLMSTFSIQTDLVPVARIYRCALCRKVCTEFSIQYSIFCYRPALCCAATNGRPRLKCDGTRAETRFRLLAKRTSPFKSAGASVQSAGSRGVRCSNAGYTMFRGSVKSTGYPLHSPVSPSLPLSCVTMCHQVSTGLYVSTVSARVRAVPSVV
jgi:hypothetical protein